MQSESALIPEYPVFPVSTTGAVRSIINSERGRLYIYKLFDRLITSNIQSLTSKVAIKERKIYIFLVIVV